MTERTNEDVSARRVIGPSAASVLGERERAYPVVFQVVIDAVDTLELAEFYRHLLGLEYRDGDAPSPDGPMPEWIMLVRDGRRVLTVQRARHLPRPTWPSDAVPQQVHLDLTVSTLEELHRQRDRALALGARLLEDRTQGPDEPLYVFADPAGHPLCIFVAAQETHGRPLGG